MSIYAAPSSSSLFSSYRPPEVKSVSFWTSALFFFSICYILVNGTPFPAAFHDVTEETSSNVAGTTGDSSRQIVYFVILLISTYFVVMREGVRSFKYYPKLITILAIYSVMSALWAVAPSISIRRSILTVVVIASFTNCVIVLGWQNCLKILTNAISALVIVSLISVAIIPKIAIHQGGDVGISTDTGLVGDWRGIFVQKNHAAAVAAIGLILLLFNVVERRRMILVGEILCCLVFLAGTRGKTSLGVLVPSLAFGLACRYMMLTKARKIVFASLIGYGALVVTVVALCYQDKIARIMNNPLSFTGRVEIWDISLLYMKHHPWLGAGFGSFWQVGEKSPVFELTAEPWVAKIFHSHNGFLEMGVTLGIPGMLFAILTVVIVPFVNFFRVSVEYVKWNAVLATIWAFGIATNMTEAQLLSRDKQVWGMLLIVLIVQKQIMIEQKARRPAVTSYRDIELQT